MFTFDRRLSLIFFAKIVGVIALAFLQHRYPETAYQWLPLTGAFLFLFIFVDFGFYFLDRLGAEADLFSASVAAFLILNLLAFFLVALHRLDLSLYVIGVLCLFHSRKLISRVQELKAQRWWLLLIGFLVYLTAAAPVLLDSWRDTPRYYGFMSHFIALNSSWEGLPRILTGFSIFPLQPAVFNAFLISAGGEPLARFFISSFVFLAFLAFSSSLRLIQNTISTGYLSLVSFITLLSFGFLTDEFSPLHFRAHEMLWTVSAVYFFIRFSLICASFDLFLCCCSLGMATASLYSSIPFTLLIFGALAFFSRNSLRNLRRLFVYSSAAFLIPAFWYFRTWNMTGTLASLRACWTPTSARSVIDPLFAWRRCFIENKQEIQFESSSVLKSLVFWSTSQTCLFPLLTLVLFVGFQKVVKDRARQRLLLSLLFFFVAYSAFSFLIEIKSYDRLLAFQRYFFIVNPSAFLALGAIASFAWLQTSSRTYRTAIAIAFALPSMILILNARSYVRDRVVFLQQPLAANAYFSQRFAGPYWELINFVKAQIPPGDGIYTNFRDIGYFVPHLTVDPNTSQTFGTDLWRKSSEEIVDFFEVNKIKWFVFANAEAARPIDLVQGRSAVIYNYDAVFRPDIANHLQLVKVFPGGWFNIQLYRFQRETTPVGALRAYVRLNQLLEAHHLLAATHSAHLTKKFLTAFPLLFREVRAQRVATSDPEFSRYELKSAYPIAEIFIPFALISIDSQSSDPIEIRIRGEDGILTSKESFDRVEMRGQLAWMKLSKPRSKFTIEIRGAEFESAAAEKFIYLKSDE